MSNLNSRVISENEKLFFAFRNLNKKIQDVIEKLNIHKSQNQDLVSECEDIKNKLRDSRSIVERLEHEKKLFSDELFDLRKIISEKDENIHSLNQNVSNIETAKEMLKNEYTAIENDYNTLKHYSENEIRQLSEKIKGKESELLVNNDIFSQKLQILSIEKDNLFLEVDSLKNCMVEKDSIIEKQSIFLEEKNNLLLEKDLLLEHNNHLLEEEKNKNILVEEEKKSSFTSEQRNIIRQKIDILIDKINSLITSDKVITE